MLFMRIPILLARNTQIDIRGIAKIVLYITNQYSLKENYLLLVK